jgi:hypothetical protein
VSLKTMKTTCRRRWGHFGNTSSALTVSSLFEGLVHVDAKPGKSGTPEDAKPFTSALQNFRTNLVEHHRATASVDGKSEWHRFSMHQQLLTVRNGER